MLAVNQILNQQKALNPKLFNNLENKPWFIIGDKHEHVHYYYDHIVEFFGREEMKSDGLGLSFDSPHKFVPGSVISIGLPLPDSIRSYDAHVMTSRERDGIYQTGIWLNIESDFDLLTILRSCDYLDIRHTS